MYKGRENPFLLVYLYDLLTHIESKVPTIQFQSSHLYLKGDISQYWTYHD